MVKQETDIKQEVIEERNLNGQKDLKKFIKEEILDGSQEKREPQIPKKEEVKEQTSPKKNFEEEKELVDPLELDNFQGSEEAINIDIDDKPQDLDLEFNDKADAINLEMDQKPEVQMEREDKDQDLRIDQHQMGNELNEDHIDSEYDMMDKPEDFKMNEQDIIDLQNNENMVSPEDQNLLINCQLDEGQDMMEGQDESLLELD